MAVLRFHRHGPLTRYVKLRVAHAPGMPGTLSLWPRVSDPDMHHDTCVTHVPWCLPVSLTSGFLWSRWRWKQSRHSRSKRNLHFSVSDKRSMPLNRSCYYSAIAEARFLSWYSIILVRSLQLIRRSSVCRCSEIDSSTGTQSPEDSNGVIKWQGTWGRD